MAEKKTVIYKLERHKWPDEIAAEKRKRRQKLAIVCSCLLFFVAGFFVSRATAGTMTGNETSMQMEKLETVYALMNEKWYFGKDIDDLSTQLLENAIAAMAQSEVDPHTSYMSLADAQSFSTSLEGTFIGVGLQFYQNSDGAYIVADIFENSPAQKAGFQRGDRLVSIDGTDCGSLTSDAIKAMLTEKEGEAVTLVVERGDQTHTLQVTPSVVDNSVIAYVEDGYGYVRLSSFSENSAADMESALKRISDAGETKLIFDLRDNGGGYLSAALDIAKCFLPKGTVVFQSEDRNGNRSEYVLEDEQTPFAFDQIVILMNANTASASEALISALDDNLGDRVVLVGNTTYGKGTMQTSVPFRDGTSLKYTTAQWFSSKGTVINGVGIQPDVEVSLDAAKTTSMMIYKEDIHVEEDQVAEIAKPVQIYLRFLGYDADRSDAYFSARSAAALRQFESEHGLKADGVIDNETAQALADAASIYWNENREQLDTQLREAVDQIYGR